MKNLKEILESVALKKQHEENELHQFCREIDAKVKVGWSLYEAYYCVKEEYRKRKELEKLK